MFSIIAASVLPIFSKSAAFWNSRNPKDFGISEKRSFSEDLGEASLLPRYSYAAVKLVKGTHQGKAKAVNLAMRYAKGDILAILDADTLIEKDSLKKLVAPFSERNVGAVAATLRLKKSLNPLTWFQHFEYAVSSSW